MQMVILNPIEVSHFYPVYLEWYSDWVDCVATRIERGLLIIAAVPYPGDVLVTINVFDYSNV